MDFIVSVLGAVSRFHTIADELSEILICTCLVCEHIVWYCCVAFHARKCSLKLEWLSTRLKYIEKRSSLIRLPISLGPDLGKLFDSPINSLLIRVVLSIMQGRVV